MKFRLTATLDESVANFSSDAKIKSAAYEKLYEMMGNKDANTAWAFFRRIHNWEGKHTVLRHGGNSITLEIV